MDEKPIRFLSSDDLAKLLKRPVRRGMSDWRSSLATARGLEQFLNGSPYQKEFAACRLQTYRTTINNDGHEWRWNVNYKKFRGRGKEAFEKRIGADGIVQIEGVKHDRAAEAKAVLTQGIQAAIRAGNAHARSDMEGLLLG